MQLDNYQQFYDKGLADLKAESQERLVTYFQLLGQVQKPVASLVIPVYRAKENLLAHMVSLSNLKTIIPYEVIFVDNNADRETLEILNQLGAFVVKEGRQGITHARQKGLETARGQVVCSMDPDTIYDPYYIDRMVLPFFKDPKLVMCYSVSKSYGTAYRLSLKMRLRNWLKGCYFRWKLAQGFTNRIKYIRAVAMAVRREAILPIGYQTDLKVVSGCDDGMLAMELHTKGTFKYVPVGVYTALPPPREPGKPFPFCNERFLKKNKAMDKTMAELQIEKAPN